MQFSLEVVRQFARLLQQSGLQELSLQDVDDATGKPFRVVVKKGAASPSASVEKGQAATQASVALAPNGSPHTQAATDARNEAAPETSPQVVVTSNAVGLLRAMTPVLQIGDMVRVGQTVAIVESMKIPGEIASPVNGQITEILAEDGQGVEYGQSLLTILPTA